MFDVSKDASGHGDVSMDVIPLHVLFWDSSMCFQIRSDLKQLFEMLDYVSDICDDDEITMEGKVDQIKLHTTAELAELEERIVELEKLNHEN